MPKDFREHSKNYNADGDKENVRYEDLTPEGRREYDRVRETAKKYENKSESELINDLFKKVAQGKKDGTFNPAEIERFAAQLAPMLTKEQRAKMQQLLNQIKNWN